MASREKKKDKSIKPKKKVIVDIIKNRAQEIYHERIQHGRAGDADSDWFQAEKELMN